MDENKIQSVAITLLQICITILPIGAGASSYISQQDQSAPVLVSMGFVWAGLILLSLSAFLLLGVLQFSRGNALQIAKNEAKFRGAIVFFIAGTIFLVLSPGGFAYHSFFSLPNSVLRLSSDTLTVSLPKDGRIETTINTIIDGLESSEINSMKLESLSMDVSCTTITQRNEIKPIQKGDSWVVVWEIEMEPTCQPGDYVILFKLSKDNITLESSELILKINKTE